MKKILLSFIIGFFAFTAYSQSVCSKYYTFKKGATMQYTLYNKKGKKDGVSTYHVKSVTEDGDVSKAVMAVNFKDKKGKEVFDIDYKFTCTQNTVKIDYQSMLSSQMLEQYKDMDITITGSDIEVPNDLKVGQNLPDAEVNLSVNMSGMNMKTTVNTVNRKVEKKETITTPAGTFDCYVIYSEQQTKMMMMNQTFLSRVWLAEGVGMIKEESYNKKGKRISYTELTKKN